MTGGIAALLRLLAQLDLAAWTAVLALYCAWRALRAHTARQQPRRRAAPPQPPAGAAPQQAAAPSTKHATMAFAADQAGALAALEANLSASAGAGGWRAERGGDGVAVISAPVEGGGGTRRFKCVGLIPGASPADVSAALNDYSTRTSWDGTLAESSVLESGGSGGRLWQVVFYSIFPAAGGIVRARDFVDVQFTRHREDGSILTAAVSVRHDAAPERPDTHVRAANLLGSGALFSPDSGGCRFTLVAAADVGGDIPLWLINATTASKLVGVYGTLRRRFRR